jgi:hypothetical protein
LCSIEMIEHNNYSAKKEKKIESISGCSTNKCSSKSATSSH